MGAKTFSLFRRNQRLQTALGGGKDSQLDALTGELSLELNSKLTECPGKANR